ncbi:MAG TPA: hypothetical protein VJR89_07675, partial [Polyangiales bacterium]|nr:hypothetical protein [Polyangiales bacterium]
VGVPVYFAGVDGVGMAFQWFWLAGLLVMSGCNQETGSSGVPMAAAGSAGAAGLAAGSGSAGVAAAGSGSAGGAAAGSGGAAPGVIPAGAPTWSRVWEEVFLPKGCNGQYCHGSGQGGLSMKNKDDAHLNLVGVAAAGPACKAGGMLRVKASDPNASLLLDKMSHPMPSCGDMMPIGAKLAPNCLSTVQSVCTTEQELGLVKEWILAGARND